jgi:Tfp pilus assembly protein PilF
MRNARALTSWLILCSVAVFSGCAQTRQLVQNPFTRAAKQRSIQYDLAQVAEREGQLRKAADQYSELLERKPEDARYCHRLGVVKLRLGEAEEGIQLLERAIELQPDNADILNDLGYAYLECGELAQAEEQFQAALAIDPNDTRTINNLGLCAGFDGRMKEAHQYFRRAGTEAQAQANLGFVLAQRGELQLAMSHYNRALSVNPELTSAAEALVQLTSLTREPDAPEVRLAHEAAAAPQANVQHASATGVPIEVPASSGHATLNTAAQPSFGLSAP